MFEASGHNRTLLKTWMRFGTLGPKFSVDIYGALQARIGETENATLQSGNLPKLFRQSDSVSGPAANPRRTVKGDGRGKVRILL